MSKIRHIMENNQIFKEIKVLELASVLAGPSVGQFFAELGATVTKVENPITNGDVTRSWKLPQEDDNLNTSSYYASANWGKKHLFLNLRDPDERQQVLELAGKADVVICSYKPGDAEKLGVSYNMIRGINPAVIYGNISGYGEDSFRVGYDAVLQAECGLMYMNGDPDGIPTKLPVAFVDVIAAHQMKEGILTALYKRKLTGEGSFVEVSLFKSAISCLANQATNYLNTGFIPQRTGSEHPNIVPYGRVFKTKDHGNIILAIGNDKQFRHFCELIGRADLIENPEYKNNRNRVINRDTLYKILDMEIRRFEKAFLLSKMQELDIPGGGVNDMQELFEIDRAREMIMDYADSKLMGIRNVAFELK